MKLVIILGSIMLTAVIVILSVLLATNANAGQTGGFAPYARQGIVTQLHHIYGSGIPYNVRCTEHDTFNNVTGVRDVIICTVVSK